MKRPKLELRVAFIEDIFPVVVFSKKYLALGREVIIFRISTSSSSFIIKILNVVLVISIQEQNEYKFKHQSQ